MRTNKNKGHPSTNLPTSPLCVKTIQNNRIGRKLSGNPNLLKEG